MIHFVKGLAVALLLIALKVGVEHTPFGRWAERETYSLLVSLLPDFSNEGSSVVVVDIGHLPGGQVAGAGELLPTSRARLRELLDALLAQQPLAIGIDIDFSPNEKGWIDPADPAFFDHCLRLEPRVPVRLGVYRGIREARGGWRGAPRCAPLAGALWLPQDGSRRLPVSIQAGPGADELPSLGAALAQAAAPRRADSTHAFGRLVELHTVREVVPEPHATPLVMREAMVNFSQLEQAGREALPAAEPADIAKHGDRIRGRVVLIGDLKAGSANDMFIVPGDPRNRRGVLLHAALVNTLLVDPIHEFRHDVRLLLDLVLSVLTLGVVFAARRRRKARPPAARARADDHALEARVVTWTVAIVVVLGFAFVILFRILWLDFLLVVFFLAIHPTAERWFLRTLKKSHGGAASQASP